MIGDNHLFTRPRPTAVIRCLQSDRLGELKADNLLGQTR